ncbi:TetR/AcrR family transcriptional regulator [uncultured Alistipes sp.]|uniref:TetR/AcrR family transcriptional regulator n=1 Tax=uncultured Alistipes sp. TaxID=538949 RepID=UPI00320B3900
MLTILLDNIVNTKPEMHDQEKNNTEQLILEAAEQEFFAKGFGGARTAVIAEKAGVTHAMLHYYFRKKEYLFERIVAKNISLLAQTITAAMGNSDLPIVERLKSGIAAHFDLIAANPQLPRFFLNEVLSRPEHYHIMYERIKEVSGKLATLQKDVDEASGRGEIEQVDIRMLLISLLSLNVFPFIAYAFIEPVSNELLGGMMADREKYLAMRKAENIEMIMRRIKKQ